MTGSDTFPSALICQRSGERLPAFLPSECERPIPGWRSGMSYGYVGGRVVYLRRILGGAMWVTGEVADGPEAFTPGDTMAESLTRAGFTPEGSECTGCLLPKGPSPVRGPKGGEFHSLDCRDAYLRATDDETPDPLHCGA